jgi:hypothetical protein
MENSIATNYNKFKKTMGNPNPQPTKDKTYHSKITPHGA